MSRDSRKRAALTLVVAILVVAAAFSVAIVKAPNDAAAQVTCGSVVSCPDIGEDPDPSVSSALRVTHYEDALYNPRRVEPTTGESWGVTAKYASLEAGSDCRCQTEEYVASFDMDWNSGTKVFDLSNKSGHSTAPFIDIRKCSDTTCAGGGTTGNRGYGYKVAVDLAHTVWIDCPIDGWTPFYLDQVLYRTSSVDNGLLLDEGCNTVVNNPGVSPDSQTWQVGDNGAWSCADASCPTGIGIEINYN